MLRDWLRLVLAGWLVSTFMAGVIAAVFMFFLGMAFNHMLEEM